MKNIQLSIIIAGIFFSFFASYIFAQTSSNSSNEFNMAEIESIIPSAELIIYGEVVELTKEPKPDYIISVTDIYSAKVKVSETYKGKKYDYVYVKHQKLEPGLTMEEVKKIADETYKNKDWDANFPYDVAVQDEKALMDLEIGKNYTFLLICHNSATCSPIFRVHPVEKKIWENKSSFKKSFGKSYYPVIILALFYFFYILWKIKGYFNSKKESQIYNP